MKRLIAWAIVLIIAVVASLAIWLPHKPNQPINSKPMANTYSEQPIGQNNDGSFIYPSGVTAVGTDKSGHLIYSDGSIRSRFDGTVLFRTPDGHLTNAQGDIYPNADGSYGDSSGPIMKTLNNVTTPSATNNTNNTKIFGNQTFNLDDPAQRLAYYDALKTQLTQQRDLAYQQALDNWSTADKASRQTYSDNLAKLDQNIADIDAAAKDWTKNYLATVQGFNENKGQGDINRQSYFAQLSPNAFQSSQATSQQYANNKYVQGLSDLAGQAQNAVGLGYVNAFDPNNANSVNDSLLDPSSQYGRNYGSAVAQKNSLANAFANYNAAAAKQLQDANTQIGQNYQSALASNAENLGQLDLAQGVSPFKYGVQTTTPYQAPAIDLSQYTPYTTFGSLSDTSIPGNTYTPPVKKSLNAFQQPTLDSWLGRTNTVLPTSQKNQWFDVMLNNKLYS
jgi:hypothetical protein